MHSVAGEHPASAGACSIRLPAECILSAWVASGFAASCRELQASGLCSPELALSAAVLANPLEVFRQPARDWNENDLRHIVGMKRSKLVLKR